MRVCILSSRFYPQIVGSGTSAHLMAKSLAHKGHEVTVIVDATAKTGVEQENQPYKVLYIHGLEAFATGNGSFRGPTEELYQIVQKVSPDIMHVCNFMPMLLVTMIRDLLSFPVVFTFYNTPVKHERSIGYFDNNVLDINLASFIIQNNAYDSLIVGSRHYYESALSLGAKKDKTRLSYIGIDIESFQADVEKYAALSFSEYFSSQLGPEEEYIILPSRITAQKGVIDAVRALKIINTKRPVKLVLTGMAKPFDDKYAETVLKLAKELGILDKIICPLRVIPRHHLPFFIKKAKAVIIPSYYEGLGLAAVEALAIGRPLVATKTVGLDEVVFDEINGLTVEPGNYEALASAVLRLLEDDELALGLGLKGREGINMFGIDRHINDVEQTYKLLLESSVV